jgi:hypothetical protein
MMREPLDGMYELYRHTKHILYFDFLTRIAVQEIIILPQMFFFSFFFNDIINGILKFHYLVPHQ